MKRLLFILSVVFLFIGCNSNNPENSRPKDQPCYYSKSKGQWVIDKSWTPEGHAYIRERNNGKTEVFNFIKVDVYQRYTTDKEDIFDTSEIEAQVLQDLYSINYPNITIGTETREVKAEFLDTLSLSFDGRQYNLYR